MKEFIDNIHINKDDILNKTDKYLNYSINKYQSNAFTLSILLASTLTFFLRKSFNHKNPYVKNFFQLNVFFSIQIFSYEIISKLYTDKNKLADIDYYIYAKEKLNKI
jgi:hypothetical protein